MKLLGKSNNSLVYGLYIINQDNSLLDINLALKIIQHDSNNSCPVQCAQLKNEHKLMSQLSHPNIVQLREYF